MKRGLSATFFLAVGALGALHCASAADPRVDALEADYRAKREALLRPLAAAYDEKLKALEESFTRTGDAIQLAAVKRERERLKQPAAAPAVPAAAPSAPKPAADPAATTSEVPEKAPAPTVSAAQWTADLLADPQGRTSDSGLPFLKAKSPPMPFKPVNLAPGRYRMTLVLTSYPVSAGTFRLTLNEQRTFSVTFDKIAEALARVEVALGDYEHRGGPVTLRLEQNDAAEQRIPVQSVACKKIGDR